ncbi:(2Fe-2S)-binding protein [Parasulfuritortus cantonensis]|uniref:(2Fe-2S)-binding protein n=1 Tax=Parasulfuritortus cantonensis TaxID=2528202 RepID=A0A4R1B0M6_9PROT|nr:2Fe-2S iron-sulfur cluster-binding protein [Parasulfuritortus cantonensis]TCJ11532.1 (2Fe-2S)-binding protein [Parasulfuritortus cantonensis]
MPNITFSSPLHKDKTVYAVAGSHTKTVLTLAKENHIPIDFSCQDGECGTCLVKVTNLSRKGPMGGPLTDREITVLKDLGKITQAEIDAMAVDDNVHTSWRLACQMVLRDEDILVEYPSK